MFGYLFYNLSHNSVERINVVHCRQSSIYFTITGPLMWRNEIVKDLY